MLRHAKENLFLDANPKSHEQLGLAVHKLAAGSEKARFDNPSGRDHRFVFLSNANMPLRQVVKAIAGPRIQAAEVRRRKACKTTGASENIRSKGLASWCVSTFACRASFSSLRK